MTPKIQKSRSIFTVGQFTNRVFYCIADGYPQPEISWYLNEILITGNDSVTEVPGSYRPHVPHAIKSTLTISTVEGLLAPGVYRVVCEAHSAIGIDQKDLELIAILKSK